LGESPRWNNDYNPGGIGIVANDTPQPFRIKSARVAAMVFISALNRLVEGTREEPWVRDIPAPAREWLDTVWKRHCDYAPPVVRLSDMMQPYKYPNGETAFTWAEDQSWVNGVVRRGAELFPRLGNQTNATTNDVVYGRVPRPNIIDMTVTKAGPGNGYYATAAPRDLVGGVEHITAGDASLEWYQGFFSIGGERARDALVDFIIDKAGRIGQ
jgi:hypothetical protein